MPVSFACYGQAVAVNSWLLHSFEDQQLPVSLPSVPLVGFHLTRKIVIEVIRIVRNSEE